METENVAAGVTFDENYQIRLLEADKRQLTSQLKEDCDLFLSKISQLSDIVTKFVDAAEAQRGVIEREKLRAVGMRNKVKALEMEQRKREKDEQLLLEEKREELSRLNAEYESLKKIKQEQDLMIDKLTSSGGDGNN